MSFRIHIVDLQTRFTNEEDMLKVIIVKLIIINDHYFLNGDH